MKTVKIKVKPPKFTPVLDAVQVSEWKKEFGHDELVCDVEIVCPYCGGTHTHGYGINDTITHRRSHCGEPEHIVLENGYYIQLNKKDSYAKTK